MRKVCDFFRDNIKNCERTSESTIKLWFCVVKSAKLHGSCSWNASLCQLCAMSVSFDNGSLSHVLWEYRRRKYKDVGNEADDRRTITCHSVNIAKTLKAKSSLDTVMKIFSLKKIQFHSGASVCFLSLRSVWKANSLWSASFYVKKLYQLIYEMAVSVVISCWVNTTLSALPNHRASTAANFFVHCSSVFKPFTSSEH